jgi:LemA protein
MKGTRNLALIVIGAVVLIFLAWGCGGYNGMVKSRNNVNNSWSKVEGQYQRRMDVFKNIENTIKASAKFEDTVLTKVTRARYEAEQIKLDPNNPESINQLGQAQRNLTNQFRVIFENYPTLQTTAAFRDFQTQIEGTENRIAVARMDYSNAVNEYNNKVTTFPNNIMAGIFGFKAKPYYKAEEGAEKAPDVFTN